MANSNQSEQGQVEVVDNYGITRRELDYAESLYSEIEASAKLDKNQFKKMKAWREYVRGKTKDDINNPVDETVNDSNKVRANLLHSRFSSQMSRIVARNPEASVSPAPRVNEESYSSLRVFTQTAEILLNHEFETGDLKGELKKQVRSTKETSIGWIQCFYQQDYWSDPLVKFRNDDAQDNIAQLQTKLDLMESGEINLTAEQQNTILGEIADLQTGMEEDTEILINEGFLFNKVHADNVLISPEVEEYCDYHKANWITSMVFKSVEEAMAFCGLSSDEDLRRLQQAKIYTDKNNKEQEPSDTRGARSASTEVKSATNVSGGKNEKVSGDVCIYEMQHKKHRTVYTFIEGMPGFARQPSRPREASAHWYNLFLMTFNDTDKNRFPLSDTELGAPLVDEYNQTRTDLRTHRNAVTPARVAKKGDVTPDDAANINKAKPNELVLVEGSDDVNQPISNSITQLAYSQLDPGLYDVSPARQDLDQVLGSPDLDSGVQIGDRTATAASIQNEGMQSRTTGKQDVIEEVVKKLAQHMLQIALQKMTYQQVVRVCGEGAVWPGKEIKPPTQQDMLDAMVEAQQNGTPFEMPVDPDAWINDLERDEIYSLCMVDIKGGSTGKPNKQMEQQQWMQIFPLVKESLATIAQYRMQGLEDMATAETELLKEFLRRMDEKIDVEKFLPGAMTMNPMMAGMGGAPQIPGQQPVGNEQPLPGQQSDPGVLPPLTMQ